MPFIYSNICLALCRVLKKLGSGPNRKATSEQAVATCCGQHYLSRTFRRLQAEPLTARWLDTKKAADRASHGQVMVLSKAASALGSEVV